MDVDLLCVAKSIVLQQQSSSKGNHAWRLAQALLLHLRIQVILSVTCAETTELDLLHMQRLHDLVRHMQQEQSCIWLCKSISRSRCSFDTADCLLPL